MDELIDTNFINLITFHPPEGVGRGSETQLQVGEKLNCITYQILYLLYNLICIYDTTLQHI